MGLETSKTTKITAKNNSKQPTVTAHGLIFGRAYLNGRIFASENWGALSRATDFFIFVQKAVQRGLFYFRGSSFSEGHIIGRNFTFQNGFDLSIKTLR